MKAKVIVRDIDGTTWEKEGDIGMGAMANIINGKMADIEIDFSKMTETDLTYFLATALVVASKLNPEITQSAIGLYFEKTNKLKT